MGTPAGWRRRAPGWVAHSARAAGRLLVAPVSPAGLAIAAVVLLPLVGDLVLASSAGRWLVAIFGLTGVVCTLGVPTRLTRELDGRVGRRFVLTQAAARTLTLMAGAVLVVSLVAEVFGSVSSAAAAVWFTRHGGVASLLLVLAVIMLCAALVASLAGLVPALRLRLGLRLQSATRVLSLATVFVMLLGLATVALGQFSGATYVDEQGQRLTAGIPDRSLLDAADADLLVGLAPVLSYTGDELHLPTSVDGFLAESSVSRDGQLVARNPTIATLPTRPCVGDAPCLVVDNSLCPDSEACRPLVLDESAQLGLGYDERVLSYGRVLRREDSPASVRWSVSPFGDRLQGVAQWWFFTPLDRWDRPLAMGVGSVTKTHQADWEAVTIGYGPEGPLFVGVSSHCGGTWRAWGDVIPWYGRLPVDLEPLGGLLHPLVARTDGSHGMYFGAEESRSPDLFGCPVARRLGSGALRTHGYLLNLRDGTEDNLRILPRVISGDGAHRALTLPAVWSVRNDVDLTLGGRTFGLAPEGTLLRPTGPPAPAAQRLYIDPVGTTFCSPSWHSDRGGGSRDRC